MSVSKQGSPKVSPRRIAPKFNPTHGRRAFSMLELLVVISVSALLTSIMLPTLASVKENVRRVTCMSNLRTIGAATSMFASDHLNKNIELPPALPLEDRENPRPQDLMLAHVGGEPQNWTGFGLLFSLGYCHEAKCFYCPSHEGKHPFEKYEKKWHDNQNVDPIFMNYHYAGDKTWSWPYNPRSLDEGHTFILATDGLRTQSDVNHRIGLNMLLADGSVNWNEKVRGIFPTLPDDWDIDDPKAQEEYFRVWSRMERIAQE